MDFLPDDAVVIVARAPEKGSTDPDPPLRRLEAIESRAFEPRRRRFRQVAVLVIDREPL
jgi:hypothetical protein